MYHITACTRLEDACALLAESLATSDCAHPLDGPTVLVQSRAMGRWLGTELARRSKGGVMGGLDARLVSAFCRGIVGSSGPGPDPFSEVGMLWRIDGLIADDAQLPNALEGMQPILAPLDRAGRYLLAGELAAIFDKMQICRHDTLETWRHGGDVEEAGEFWLGHLWRLLQVEGRESTDAGMAACIKRLQTEGPSARPADCPEQLYVVAPTTLTPSVIALLQALGDHRQQRCRTRIPQRRHRYLLAECRGRPKGRVPWRRQPRGVRPSRPPLRLGPDNTQEPGQ